MLSLGEFLIESPEHLDNLQGSHGDWIGEITSWWGYSTDNGDGSCTVSTKALNFTSSLVKLSQLRLHVSWVTLIGWHLGQTTRDLSQGLGPTRGGVGHHGNVVALISEILGKGDTGVNGSLSGCDRHVGGIGDQAGSLHNTLFDSFIVFDKKLREISQDLGHLISSFATSDIHDDLRVRMLGQSL